MLQVSPEPKYLWVLRRTSVRWIWCGLSVFGVTSFFQWRVLNQHECVGRMIKCARQNCDKGWRQRSKCARVWQAENRSDIVLSRRLNLLLLGRNWADSQKSLCGESTRFSWLPLTCIDFLPPPLLRNSPLSKVARVGNHAKRVNLRCELWMIRAVFTISDLAQDVCVSRESHCRVYCNRLWVDQLCNNITRVQREASLVAQKNLQKFYACSHVSTVRLIQSTIPVFSDSHSHSSPLQDELVSLSSVPIPSIDLNLWNRSRPSAFVPMSLGFTSVLTDDIVGSFLNTKSWIRILWMCFILRLAPGVVATARAVLLSALACIRNDSPISIQDSLCENQHSWQCTKSTQFWLSTGQGNSLQSSPFTRQEKLINVTQSARSAFPRHLVTGPVSIIISVDVFEGLVQVIRFQCRYRQVEIQFTCSFQISQHFLGTSQICKCWWRKFVWQAFCRRHQIWSHSGNVLQFSNSSEQRVLNLIAHCHLIVQIQALLFRQRRHHCLCVLQLNNVQAFVHVLRSRLHCESSAFAIVYTSVLESQVSYSCYCDGAHESDVPVLGCEKMPPRHHHHVDVRLAFLYFLCNDDLASIGQFAVLVQQVWNRCSKNVCN